jgi:hypothetical protein
MRDPDFRIVINKFRTCRSHGRCCFWMGTTPALSVTFHRMFSHSETVPRIAPPFPCRGILNDFWEEIRLNSVGTSGNTTIGHGGATHGRFSDSYGIAVVKATQGLVDALLRSAAAATTAAASLRLQNRINNPRTR